MKATICGLAHSSLAVSDEQLLVVAEGSGGVGVAPGVSLDTFLFDKKVSWVKGCGGMDVMGEDQRYDNPSVS